MELVAQHMQHPWDVTTKRVHSYDQGLELRLRDNYGYELVWIRQLTRRTKRCDVAERLYAQHTAAVSLSTAIGWQDHTISHTV